MTLGSYICESRPSRSKQTAFHFCNIWIPASQNSELFFYYLPYFRIGSNTVRTKNGNLCFLFFFVAGANRGRFLVLQKFPGFEEGGALARFAKSRTESRITPRITPDHTRQNRNASNIIYTLRLFIVIPAPAIQALQTGNPSPPARSRAIGMIHR